MVDRKQGGEGWPEQGFGDVENQEAGKEWVVSKEATEEDGKEEDEQEEEEPVKKAERVWDTVRTHTWASPRAC